MRLRSTNLPGNRQPLDHTVDEAIALWTESRRRARRCPRTDDVYVLTGKPNLAAVRPGAVAAVIRILTATLGDHLLERLRLQREHEVRLGLAEGPGWNTVEVDR